MSDVQSNPSRRPDWAARTVAAEFEPLPQVGPLEAARRYWILVLLPVLVLVPLAAVVAANRTPTYTAESRLIVGRLNMSTAGAVQGFAAAAQDLASTYPLVIDAAGVVNPVARTLRTTPGDVSSRLSATQVPSSPVVRLIATGTSEADATNLANVASNALVSFLTKFDRSSPDLAYLDGHLRAAELAYQKAAAALAAKDNTPPLKPAVQRLAATADAAKTHLGAISADYQNTVQSQATSSLLQSLVYAHGARSDRQSKLEISVFIALICAVLVGLGLATVRANQVARRTLMAPPWTPDKPGSAS